VWENILQTAYNTFLLGVLPFVHVVSEAVLWVWLLIFLGVFVVVLWVLWQCYVYLFFYMCVVVVLVVLCVYCFRICCTMCELLYIGDDGFTVEAELLARSQYSEGPATDHLDRGVSWFPCVYKQMLRWLPTFQFATTCFSCSPPDLNLNLSLTSFIFCLLVK
jgi:hypothetical protein